MKIVIEDGIVTVHHGLHGRLRETSFDEQWTAVAERQPPSPAGLPPALNRYEWAQVKKLMAVIENAVNREDTPSRPFEDLLPVSEKLSPGLTLTLSRPAVKGSAMKVSLVRELEADDFVVNEVNGLIEITNRVALADIDRATYVEVEYGFKPPPMMASWDRPR
jgi:hypothetical protein